MKRDICFCVVSNLLVCFMKVVCCLSCCVGFFVYSNE